MRSTPTTQDILLYWTENMHVSWPDGLAFLIALRVGFVSIAT